MTIQVFPRDVGREWYTLVSPSPIVLIYKHSPICGVSAVANDQVNALARAHPELPIWRVDVVRQQKLSRQIAEDLGVPHASPQVILLLDGEPAWAATHYDIMRPALLRVVETAEPRSAMAEPPVERHTAIATHTLRIELVYFEGCPHVAEARTRLRQALAVTGLGSEWTEWDAALPVTPAAYRRLGSPTILVNGEGVAGSTEGAGLGCVIHGAPSVEKIVEAVLEGVASRAN